MAAANKDKQASDKLAGNNLYVVLVLVTLLVVGGSAIVTKFLIGSVSINTKVVSAKNAANKQLQADLQAAPQLIDAYKALGSQQQVLADALPETADVPDLIVTLNNMANNSGITLESVAPNEAGDTSASGAAPASGSGSGGASVSVPTPTPYAFSITFQGSYPSLTRMLNEIETSARPMVIQGVELTGTGSDLTGTIDLETFYQAAGQLPFGEETIR